MLHKKGESNVFWIAIILIIGTAFAVNILEDTTGEAVRNRYPTNRAPSDSSLQPPLGMIEPTPSEEITIQKISYQEFKTLMNSKLKTSNLGTITIEQGTITKNSNTFSKEVTHTYDTTNPRELMLLKNKITEMAKMRTRTFHVYASTSALNNAILEVTIQ
ncbi:MAG: hypothetical protein Q7R56_00045 [Nanoarchaeota archaeon]|nr:hypothetical protein [Nanoarchaeota archaeon]